MPMTPLTCPVLREEYCVDHEEELKLPMLEHNARCTLGVLGNPAKFPRADVEGLRTSLEAHRAFLARHGRYL